MRNSFIDGRPFDKLSTTKRYAQNLAAMKDEIVHVFEIPAEAGAHRWGMRFGTFFDSERDDYPVEIIASFQPETA